MEHVRDISASVRGGMEEISVGTTEIGDMMQHLSTVTRDVTDEIDRLGNSVARFHTLKVELHEKDLDVAAAEAER
jgi:methyl-accepting chemotaxis protein